MEKCYYCDYQINSKIKFAKHVLYEHKLNKQNYLIQTKYDGIQPTCKCGCGELMKYNAVLADFPTYNKKHLKIINKNKTFEEIWGNPKSEKRVKAISDARKKRFASGEYNHVKDAIKKGRKDPKLGKSISKGAKGIPKPKPKGFGIGRKHSDETKEKMSLSAIKNILLNNNFHTSLLENKFKLMLDSLNIKYIHSYFVSDIKKVYDFYIPDYSIFIEVDGNFYHCNPKFYNSPVCRTQEINIENDKLKNQWASDNGYKLLRFWEDDINNNLSKVKNILLESLKK
jgi:hypothetical protein